MLTARIYVAGVVDKDAVQLDIMRINEGHSPVEEYISLLPPSRMRDKGYAYHIWLLRNVSPLTTEFVSPLKVRACGRPG